MTLDKNLAVNEILIGEGRIGKVYRAENDPQSPVRKEFSPNYFACAWNWFFFKSTHPASTEAGRQFHYFKRRLAHRLALMAPEENGSINIVDALEPTETGFKSLFIEGNHTNHNSGSYLSKAVDPLEEFFDAIGMPTFSISPRNPAFRSNFIGNHAVDYEQAIAVPDSRGNMGYDRIYFDDVGRYISANRQKILDRQGLAEGRSLEEAFELSRQYSQKIDITPRKINKYGETFFRALSKRELALF